MFDSLRRWLGTEVPTAALPLDVTIRAMDEGCVEVSNDEVAAYVQQHPDRLRGVAGADLRKPMEAVHELRRRVDDGFIALRIVPSLWELPPTDRR
jgi:uncharacterized protein